MACPDEAVVVLDALVRSAPWYKAIWHRLCGGVRKALPASLAAGALVVLSGCATIHDIETEIAGRKHADKAAAMDARSAEARIDLYADRYRDILARVEYLERLAAPNDPDGLAENPDLETTRAEEFKASLDKMRRDVAALKTDWDPKRDMQALSEQAAAQTDAELCIKGLRDRDQFMINVSCKLNCDAMVGASSDLEITDEVRDFIHVTLRKCRTERQDRAFNRLVCGKDVCPK